MRKLMKFYGAILFGLVLCAGVEASAKTTKSGQEASRCRDCARFGEGRRA